MRVHRSIIAVAVVTGLVTLAAQPVVASQPTIPQYFDYTLEPKSLPDKSGPVELLLTFKMKPEYECDSVLVQVGGWKDLVYDGPAEFWASLVETGEYSTSLSVTVPPNDTSVLVMRLLCPGCGQGFSKTFITTGDTIAVLDYIPTPKSPPVRRSADRYLVRDGEWRGTYDLRHRLTKEQLQARQTVAVGLSDPEDFAFAESLLGPIPDSAMIPGSRNAYLLEMTQDHLLRMTIDQGIRVDLWPEQTELVFRPEIQQPEETPSAEPIIRSGSARVTRVDSSTPHPLDMKSRLGREPLEGKSGQISRIDGQDWIHYERDTTYRSDETLSDEQLLRAAIERAMARFEDSEPMEVLIDMREPDKEAIVRQLVDGLIPSETAGHMYATISKETATALLDKGVVFFPKSPLNPRKDTGNMDKGQQPDVTGDSSEVQPPEAFPSDENATVIFHEGFESSWGATWLSVDVNHLSGYDTWGPSTVEDHTGFASAWCSGNGQMTDGGGYAPNSWTSLWLNDLIDVSGYTGIELSFAMWANVELAGSAIMQVYYRWGIEQWRYLDRYDASHGWQIKQYPLYYQGLNTELNLKFYFESAEYTGYRGFYIDNVRVRGSQDFNLRAYTPAGWDYPLVPSSVSGTHTVDQLTGGEVTYIDLCLINDGPGTCDNAQIDFWVDGDCYVPGTSASWTVSDWVPGNAIYIEDFPYVIVDGWHNLLVRVATLDHGIVEPNDEDNCFSNDWYWAIPTIVFSGYARYWDMNPEADSTLPIRNAVIEMLDAESGSPELVETTTTGDYGYFSFPVVDNYDDPAPFQTVVTCSSEYIPRMLRQSPCCSTTHHIGNRLWRQICRYPEKNTVGDQPLCYRLVASRCHRPIHAPHQDRRIQPRRFQLRRRCPGNPDPVRRFS